MNNEKFLLLIISWNSQINLNINDKLLIMKKIVLVSLNCTLAYCKYTPMVQSYDIYHISLIIFNNIFIYKLKIY